MPERAGLPAHRAATRAQIDDQHHGGLEAIGVGRRLVLGKRPLSQPAASRDLVRPRRAAALTLRQAT